MTQPPPDTPPPAVKSSPIKPLTLIACGVLLAALLLAVVMSIEAPAPTGTKPGNLEAFEVDELIAPSNLSEEDLDVGDSSMGRGIDLEVGRGGSIDIVNKNGELAQRYRYRNLDPSPDDLPDNWYRMEQPVAQFFLPNNRVLILSGESAQAYAPNRVIESGTITGDVLIRLFETPDGRPVNVQKDAPSLVVRMEEAQFNNLLGEVRCDGWVRIESRAVELLGQKLTALIDDQHGHLRLWIDRVDYIRLAASGRSPGSPTVADSQPSPAAPIGASDEPPEPMAGAPGEPAETEAQFYRLTIDGNVRVRQGTGGHARIATGDTLFLVFSPQSESLGDMLAGRPRRGSRRAGVDTESPPHLFGRGSQSRAFPLDLNRSYAHSRHPGQLPFASPTLPLAPSLGGRGVLAARHRWVPHSLSPSVPSDLTSPTPPHTIVHPRSDDDIFIHCSGGLTLFPVTDPSEQPSRIDDAYLELLGRPVRLHDAAEQVSAECAQLRYEAIAKRVELIGSQTYPLRLEAQQLLARGERFWLRQTDYVSGFEGPGWITAREPAHLETAVAERPLRIDWQENVELHFDEPDETGWPRHLRRALFRGNVAAADDQRTVWSDALGVTFSDREASGTTGDDELQVESLTAEGNVQVLLSNGARAFAEKMTGEAAASTIELSGPNTTIAYDTMLIDNGTFVTFDEATQIARWEGPGRARFYPEPIETALAQRIERPHLAVEPQMRATWSGLMLLDGQANDGAGSLDLEGNVEATSRPSPLERRWLKAEMVHLDFGPDPDAPRKNLRRLIAVGNARMESRTWLTERHLDTPRLFHVAGPRIEYDADTAEVHVIGAGELLVRDLREIADDEDATAFSGKGTTLFRWKGDLHMTEAGEDLFDVEMRDDVEVLHSGPDNQTLTMRCQHLVATIERSGAGGAGGAGGEPGDFGLDGPAKLRRLRATGAVFVRTDTRDVDCHEFTYDTETQLAEATALPGRKVSVLTRGSAQRFRAEHMLWNMKLDTVRFKAISGGSNR